MHRCLDRRLRSLDGSDLVMSNKQTRATIRSDGQDWQCVRIGVLVHCDLCQTRPALHWERGRPARRERAARTVRLELSILRVGGDARGPSEELNWLGDCPWRLDPREKGIHLDALCPLVLAAGT